VGFETGPSGGGVNLGEWEFSGEQFTDDFFAFDHEEAEGFAVLLLAEGAEALEVGFGGHGPMLGRFSGRWQAARI
jgi:hypothetical protein